MKVVYVHHNSHTGGASNSLKYLLQELNKKKIEIHIICPPGKVLESFLKITKNVYQIEGIPLLMATSGINFPLIRSALSFRYFSQHKRIYSIIRKINPDVVHLNEIGQFLLAKKIKKQGYKVVLHARVAINRKYNFLTRLTEKMINTYVDCVFAIDGSVKYNLKNLKNLKIVYNPLNPFFKTLKINNIESKVNCLFLANLLKYKGVSTLLDSVLHLRHEKNIKFLIAGSNVKSKKYFNSFIGKLLHKLDIYPNYEKILKDIVIKYSLKNVIILGQVKNIEKILEKTDILLLPTLMNEPSRSVFEAGCLGIPTVISLRDKVEDVVTHGFNGIIIEENNYKQLSEAILNLANDKAMRQKLGKNSKKRFEKLNNPTLAAEIIFKTYQNILNY